MKFLLLYTVKILDMEICPANDWPTQRVKWKGAAEGESSEDQLPWAEDSPVRKG